MACAIPLGAIYGAMAAAQAEAATPPRDQPPNCARCGTPTLRDQDTCPGCGAMTLVNHPQWKQIE
jgi:hypothetical protein